MKKLDVYSLSELKDNELKEIYGGFLGGIAAAFGIIVAPPYGAGYLYGKLTCEE